MFNRHDRAFVTPHRPTSLDSAERVVPFLISLLQPRSVLDIGCGKGSWLSIFRRNGVEDVIGCDLRRKELRIPADRFVANDAGQHFSLDRRFDLALSIEVAEHVPAQGAQNVVDNLCAHSDVILFSAAIPNQGGPSDDKHVNEQWPEYWQRFFDALGYEVIDCLRYRFWKDAKISTWYRQNLLLYVRRSILDVNPRLRGERDACKNHILSVVHPETFYPYPLSFFQMLRSMPGSFLRGLKNRL